MEWRWQLQGDDAYWQATAAADRTPQRQHSFLPSRAANVARCPH
jgi:hypothetical protein